MPPVNSAGHQPAGGTGLEHRLLQGDRVEQVAALAADRLREGDAEQPLLRGGPVQLARDLAGVLPLLEVRRDLAADELGRGLLEGLRGSSFIHSEPLLDVHDPRAHPLAEALGLRVEAGRRGDAVAEQAADQHVDGAEVGQHVDLDVEVGGLGDQLADLACGVISLVSQVTRASYFSEPSWTTHSPRLASPPLSPERACTKVPSGIRRVSASAGAGYGEGRRPASVGTSPNSVGSATTSRRPSACTTVWVTAVRSTYSGR